ncbi:hypothetical protein ZWY2020_001582 [Hordeum vulgare]|nr:hypothetical protein ZWY2020_001582 [Hordeum vulgare]
MRELVEEARLAKARPAAEEAIRRRDIERRRAAARRKVDRMAGTVEFNDPYTDPADVTRSPEELLEARQEAWRAQAQLIAMARSVRRRETDAAAPKRCAHGRVLNSSKEEASTSVVWP